MLERSPIADNQINDKDEKMITRVREWKSETNGVYGREEREQRARARGLKSYLILGGGHNSPGLFPSPRARSFAHRNILT